jgi:NAD(P)-dependent dehydrogenase (short-subunit alcohol dehydrogenase family)
MFSSDVLKGKRILVTGGGTGLGKQMSVGFAAHGAIRGLRSSSILLNQRHGTSSACVHGFRGPTITAILPGGTKS